MTAQFANLRERIIADLIEDLDTALCEFWHSHDCSCESDEDRFPEECRHTADAAIVRRVRDELEEKTLAQLQELTDKQGSLWSLIVWEALEDAAAAVEVYFQGFSYR